MAGRSQLPGIAEAQAHRDDWRMSPGVISNRLMFLTGMTGNRNDGSITSDPDEQIRDAFAEVAGVFGSAAGSPRMVCWSVVPGGLARSRTGCWRLTLQQAISSSECLFG